MEKLYGFYTEEYDNGFGVETLMTGDGKAQFTDIGFDNGNASIAMSYGLGKGVGVKNHKGGEMNESTLIKWQIKFESQGSVDAMIETLLRVKNRLSR